MRIVYPYNEILPKRSAHDIFIFDECASLAKKGCDVTMLCGKGGKTTTELFEHYHVPNNAFAIKQLPIVRKNNWFNASWNLPFLLFSQQQIKKICPDWIFLSVRKQGLYHLFRKLPNARYLYEIHELAFYPYMKKCSDEFYQEKRMLERADLITVTTSALKEILIAPPYSLRVPIEVVSLAVKTKSLPPPERESHLNLMYIGQLYAGQGIPKLLSAMHHVEGVKLKIVGGKEREIADLKSLAEKLGVQNRVEFIGYLPPAQLSKIAQQADAFVAPFELVGRMPYVAHTKLFEYAHWGRPIIAPDMPSVREHLSEGRGVLLYEPSHTEALVKCINSLKDKSTLTRLQNEMSDYRERFTWERRAAHYFDLLSCPAQK